MNTEALQESIDRMTAKLEDIRDAALFALGEAAKADRMPGDIYPILSAAICKARAICGQPLACAGCDKWPAAPAEGVAVEPRDTPLCDVPPMVPAKRDWLEMPFGFKLSYFGGGERTVFIGKRPRVVNGKQHDQICEVVCKHDEVRAIVRLDNDPVVKLGLVESGSRHLLNRVGVAALYAVLREKERGYEKRARHRAKARAAKGKEAAND